MGQEIGHAVVVGFVQFELGQVEPVKAGYSGQDDGQTGWDEGVELISFSFDTPERSKHIHLGQDYTVS